MSDLTDTERKALKYLGLSEPPERFKQLEQLTVDDHAALQRLDGPERIESDDYRRYRAAVDAAGIDADLEPDLEAMSVEQHINRKRSK